MSLLTNMLQKIKIKSWFKEKLRNRAAQTSSFISGTTRKKKVITDEKEHMEMRFLKDFGCKTCYMFSVDWTT